MFKAFLYWLEARKNQSGLIDLIDDARDLDFKDIVNLVGAGEEYKPQQAKKELFPVYEKDQLLHGNCSFQMWARILSVYFGEDVSACYLTTKAYQVGLCEKGGAAQTRNGARVAKKYGVVFEKDCPSDESLPWEEYINIDLDKLDKLAAKHKIVSYGRIRNVSELLEAIDCGYAVATGRGWFSSMNQGGGFAKPWIIRRLGFLIGGHATAAIGYDTNYQGEQVTIEANSYSNKWGDNGKFYCPLRDIQVDIDRYGAFAVSRVPYTPKEVKINLLKKLLRAYQQLLVLVKKKK